MEYDLTIKYGYRRTNTGKPKKWSVYKHWIYRGQIYRAKMLFLADTKKAAIFFLDNIRLCGETKDLLED